MSILPIIAGFGGGVIGAYMGALPAFIMTGLFAFVGALIQAAGVTTDVGLLGIAFASFIGPHTAFAGASSMSKSPRMTLTPVRRRSSPPVQTF